MSTILQITNADRNLSHFCKALRLTGMEEKLYGAGPFTLLCPVNLAFGRMEDMTLDDLMEPFNNQTLVELLSSHILMGKNMAGDFVKGRKMKTIDGKEITIDSTNNEASIYSSRILSRDRQGKNGVVHTIDAIYTIPTLPEQA